MRFSFVNYMRLRGRTIRIQVLNVDQLWAFGLVGSCLDLMKTAFPDGFDEVSIATILKQALQGLDYLHKNGHIHRQV